MTCRWMTGLTWRVRTKIEISLFIEATNDVSVDATIIAGEPDVTTPGCLLRVVERLFAPAQFLNCVHSEL